MPNKYRRERNKPASNNQNMSRTLRPEASSQCGSQAHQAVAYGEEVGLMVEVQIMAEDIFTKLNQARSRNSITDLPPSEKTRDVFVSVRGRIITALKNALHLLEGPRDSSHGSAASIPIAPRHSHQSNIPPNENPPYCPEVPHVHYHTHNLGEPCMPTAAHDSYHVLVQPHGHPSCYPHPSVRSPCVPYGPYPQPNPYAQYHQPEQCPSPAHAYHAGQRDPQYHTPSQDASVQAGVPQDQGN